MPNLSESFPNADNNSVNSGAVNSGAVVNSAFFVLTILDVVQNLSDLFLISDNKSVCLEMCKQCHESLAMRNRKGAPPKYAIANSLWDAELPIIDGVSSAPTFTEWRLVSLAVLRMTVRIVHGGQGRVLHQHTWTNSSIPTPPATHLPRVLNEDDVQFRCIIASALTSAEKLSVLTQYTVSQSNTMNLLRWLQSNNDLYNGVEIVTSEFRFDEQFPRQSNDAGIPADVVVVQTSVADVSEQMARDVAPRHNQTTNESTDEAGSQVESASLLMNIDQTSEEIQVAQACIKLILVKESNVFESMYEKRSQCRLFPSLFPYGRGDFHGILNVCLLILMYLCSSWYCLLQILKNGRQASPMMSIFNAA